MLIGHVPGISDLVERVQHRTPGAGTLAGIFFHKFIHEYGDFRRQGRVDSNQWGRLVFLLHFADHHGVVMNEGRMTGEKLIECGTE